MTKTASFYYFKPYYPIGKQGSNAQLGQNADQANLKCLETILVWMTPAAKILMNKPENVCWLKGGTQGCQSLRLKRVDTWSGENINFGAEVVFERRRIQSRSFFGPSLGRDEAALCTGWVLKVEITLHKAQSWSSPSLYYSHVLAKCLKLPGQMIYWFSKYVQED